MGKSLSSVFAALAVLVSSIATPVVGDELGGLPPGAGDEDVFHTCAACHSINMVLQQRLSRPVWQEVIDTMVATHGMPKPDGAERQVLLEYLAFALGPPGVERAELAPLSRTPEGPPLSRSPE